MHLIHTKPEELRRLVQKFRNGEVIYVKGRGDSSKVECGRVEDVEVPDVSAQTVVIDCTNLHSRQVNRKAGLPNTIQWGKIQPSTKRLVFNYSWFYTQKKGARLKLESGPEDERCWLCSSEYPIYLDLFRATILRLILEESVERENRFQGWFRRWRSRLVPLL